MKYYCEICDKTVKPKSKNIHLTSLTHIQYEESIRLNHTIKNPNFFDIDKIFNDYIANQNKKFDLYLFKYEFKLDFNILTPHIKTEFYRNTAINNLKRFFLMN